MLRLEPGRQDATTALVSALRQSATTALQAGNGEKALAPEQKQNRRTMLRLAEEP